MVKPKIPPFAVPKRWPNSTIAIFATGESLTQADVDYVRGKVDATIAINNAHTIAPWADCLYACDAKFWFWHKGVPSFAGEKYGLDKAIHRADVHVLRNTGTYGLELDPTGLRTGRCSGYQAINLSVHFGATRIVLLGYNMQGSHFFGRHPDNSKPPFTVCLRAFATMVEPLNAAGVTVINCTTNSALTCFQQMALAEALAERAA